MSAYILMASNIIRSKHIFVGNEKKEIEILFSNYIFVLTLQSPSLKMDFGKWVRISS